MQTSYVSTMDFGTTSATIRICLNLHFSILRDLGARHLGYECEQEKEITKFLAVTISSHPVAIALHVKENVR